MFDCVPKTPCCLQRKKKQIIIILYNFINCLAVQILNKLCTIKQQQDEYNQRDVYYVCVKRITLSNCLRSFSPSSRDFPSVIRNIRKLGAENYFTDHRTANTIYGFREIQFRVLKYTTVIRIRKNLSNLPFLSKRQLQSENSECVYVNNPLQTVLKHFKLYILTQIV